VLKRYNFLAEFDEEKQIIIVISVKDKQLTKGTTAIFDLKKMDAEEIRSQFVSLFHE